MPKYFMIILPLLFLSCEKQEPKPVGTAENPYAPLIEKAKQTEAHLQKKADSILSEQDALGIPRR